MKKLLTVILVLFIGSCSSVNRTPASKPSILYIGDSQTEGALGGIIHEHLLKSFNETEIFIYGIGSSSPRHWSATKNDKNGEWLCSRKGRFNGTTNISLSEKVCPLEDQSMIFSHLNREKPEFVIFQFLGNSMGFNRAYISEKITRLLNDLGNQDCLFITSPPYYYTLKDKNILRKETEDYFLEAIKDRCKVIRGMSDDNHKIFSKNRENYLNDLIHLSSTGATAFFKQINGYLPK